MESIQKEKKLEKLNSFLGVKLSFHAITILVLLTGINVELPQLSPHETQDTRPFLRVMVF